MAETNYKPFDLEKAKSGAKVITRNGRPARIICTNLKGIFPIGVAVTERDNDSEYENPYTYTLNGRYYKGDNNSDLDLFMCPPERHVGWINIYRLDDESTATSKRFESKEDAEKNILNEFEFVQTIKIEWEE